MSFPRCVIGYSLPLYLILSVALIVHWFESSFFIAHNRMKVPCARTPGGVLCFADSAVRGDYACVCCATPVVLKRGKVKVPHFAHKSTGLCEGEKHKYTKEWIASLATDPNFSIQSSCACGNTHEVFRGELDKRAHVEYPVDNRRYVVDCCITFPPTFVEVRDTHAAGDEKMRWLEARGTAVEVYAVDLVKTKYPRTFQTIAPRCCRPCVVKSIDAKRNLRLVKREQATKRAIIMWRTYKKRKADAFVRHYALRWLFLSRIRSCHAHTLAACKREYDRCECGKWFETLCTRCFVVCECGEVERIEDGCTKRLRRACVVCGTWGRRKDMFPIGKSYVCACAPLCLVCNRRMTNSDYGGRCRGCNTALHNATCACGRGYVYKYGLCYRCNDEKRAISKA